MYEFWYDYVKPKYGEQAKIVQKMLKLDLILQIMNYIDHCLKENIKK